MDQPEVPGYRIAGQLGAGASGTVWAATRERDGADLAVKVVRVGADVAEADRVAQELGVLQRVHVEGMVAFHEALGLAGDPPSVAIVLDRVDGGSLTGVLRARGHLSVGEAVTVLTPVARALADLHTAGVVHGDVSPGNVLVERSGRPLLADLGVSRLIGQEPNEVHGTFGFVEPEVTMGAVPGPPADVYAVGALAWCCVTGTPPGPPALRRPLAELAPGLPEPWVQTVLRCLAADPAERPAAAEAALLFFDAAPCEPLRLVVAGDETSLLTARIRSGAPPPVDAEPSRRRWGRGPRERVVGAAGRLGRVRPRVPEVRRRAPRAVPPWSVAPALVPVLVLAMVLAAAAAAVAIGPTLTKALAAADPSSSTNPLRSATGPPRSEAGPAAVAATPKPAAHGPQADPQLDPAAPRADPRGLMQAMAHRRAAAMNSGRLADLTVLDAPGSPALASDSAHLRKLAHDALGYEAVALTVRSARTIRHDALSATVRAVVDTSAHRVRGASGTVQERPATAGEELDFDLRHAHGRWLVVKVTAVAAAKALGTR